MTQQDKEQLKLEIDHIFESGANEIRIYEMVVNFIDSRNGVKLFCQPHVMRSVCCDAELIKFKTYGYDECVECGKTYKQTDA